MATVRELVTRLGFSVDQSGVRRAESAVSRIKDRANQAAVEVRTMLAAFVGFQGLKALGQTADEVQSLEARMGQMTQTMGAAGDTFDTVSRSATASRQDLAAYANLYIRIGNASQDLIKDQSRLLGIVDTISQAMVVGGVAATEQASAMLQLSQAFNKGKLDGDEFRAVMEAMPPAFTRGLAAAMGFTGGLKDFYKASADGKLTIDGLIVALEKIGPGIQQQFMNMPLTLSQSFTIINNRFKTFVGRMNRESSAVTKTARFFLDVFDKIESGVNRAIKFVGGFENALKLLGIALAAIAVPAAVWVLIGAISAIMSPIGLVVSGLFLLGIALEDVYQWMAGGKSVIGAWLGDFQTWKDGVIQLAKDVWKWLDSLGRSIVGLAKIIWGALTFDKESILGGLRDLQSELPAVLNGLLKTFYAVFIDPLTQAFSKMWENTLNEIRGIGNQLAKLLPDWAVEMINGDAATQAAPPVYGPEVPVVPPGGMGNNTSMNQTINLTVPPGTPQEQQDAIKRAAGEAFDPMQKFSNGMAVYGR